MTSKDYGRSWAVNVINSYLSCLVAERKPTNPSSFRLLSYHLCSYIHRWCSRVQVDDEHSNSRRSSLGIICVLRVGCRTEEKGSTTCFSWHITVTVRHVCLLSDTTSSTWDVWEFMQSVIATSQQYFHISQLFRVGHDERERFSESFTFVLNILLRRHHCRERSRVSTRRWLLNIQLAEFGVKNWI